MDVKSCNTKESLFFLYELEMLEMKYSIDNFIGQEVKRITFLLKKTDGKYHYLFSIIERLENDAVENVISPKKSETFRAEKEDGGKDKIYVEIDYVMLEEVMAREKNEICGGRDLTLTITRK